MDDRLRDSGTSCSIFKGVGTRDKGIGFAEWALTTDAQSSSD